MALFDHLDLADYALPDDLRRDLSSPTLVVFLDKVRANVAHVVSACGGPERWQPHVKTTKIPRVWRELVDAGIRSFKCATTREALVLAGVLDAADIEDAEILCAYPLVGPSLTRLGEIAEQHARVKFSVLCEDARAVASIPAVLEIFIDVNPGMDRTGIPRGRLADALDVARAAGPRLGGVHWYDGHQHADGYERRGADVHANYAIALDLLAQLEHADTPARVLITAGTPAFLHALDFAPFAALEQTTHRVSPGTVVYHDARSQTLNPAFALQPAALVFARVVSQPTSTRVTVDAGSKAVAAEAGDPCARVLGRSDLIAAPPSEEHLPLDVTSGDVPERGTELLLIPEHVCPTVNLADAAVLIEDGRLVEIVDVAARGHEVYLRRSP